MQITSLRGKRRYTKTPNTRLSFGYPSLPVFALFTQLCTALTLDRQHQTT